VLAAALFAEMKSPHAEEVRADLAELAAKDSGE
jgi:hypothetical protein